MAIHYYSENVKKPKLRYRLISKWLKSIIAQNNKTSGDITFIFCNDDYLLEVNNKYLNHEYYTDIITFDYTDKNIISGDIFISSERVADNSVKFGVNLEDEFLRVISHGILHLLNYSDGSEKEKEFMRNLESDCISLFKKLENDGSFHV